MNNFVVVSINRFDVSSNDQSPHIRIYEKKKKMSVTQNSTKEKKTNNVAVE